MMAGTHRTLLAALCACFGAAAAASGASRDDVRQFLQSGVDEVLAVAYDDPVSDEPLSARVEPVLERYFDVEAITRRAVGPRWRNFSREQRARVVELFRTVVLRTYVDNFEPSDRPVIEIGTPSRLADTRWEVPTTTTYEGNRYSVAYRVVAADGELRIYDIVAEGVSMISNYRGQFESILRTGGFDALIESLERNIAASRAAQ